MEPIGGRTLTKPIVYVDRSDIEPGRVADLRKAVRDLVAFIGSREPQLISYGFYIDEDAETMTVVAVHPDTASLELHLDVGGGEFRKVGHLITLRLIEVFGEPSDAALDQLHQKAAALGGATVVVRLLDAGFARVPSLAG
jgi:hypothetical protein